MLLLLILTDKCTFSILDCVVICQIKKKSQAISTDGLILLSLTDCFEGEQQYYVSGCESPTGI